MTSEFKEADKLCGVRLLDKSKRENESVFRIEIWTKFANEEDESARNMRKYIEEVFIKLIREGTDGRETPSIKFSSHSSSGSSKPYLNKHTSSK